MESRPRALGRPSRPSGPFRPTWGNFDPFMQGGRPKDPEFERRVRKIQLFFDENERQAEWGENADWEWERSQGRSRGGKKAAAERVKQLKEQKFDREKNVVIAALDRLSKRTPPRLRADGWATLAHAIVPRPTTPPWENKTDAQRKDLRARFGVFSTVFKTLKKVRSRFEEKDLERWPRAMPLEQESIVNRILGR